MNASDKFEKLIEQYITVEDDGTVRLKGVRQPRFSDLMKLATIVQNIRAQRAANEPQTPFSSLTDEQLVAQLADSLDALDAPLADQLLQRVAARRGMMLVPITTPDPQPAQPSSADAAPREEREPTEGEERYSVANHVHPVSSDEDTPSAPSAASSPTTPTDRKQGAAARSRVRQRGTSGTTKQRTSDAGVDAPTLSPAKVRPESETD